jgi:hypothetical protein
VSKAQVKGARICETTNKILYLVVCIKHFAKQRKTLTYFAQIGKWFTSYKDIPLSRK